LPKVVTRRCLEQDLNQRPSDRKSNALPLHHRATVGVNLAGILGDEEADPEGLGWEQGVGCWEGTYPTRKGIGEAKKKMNFSLKMAFL